MCCCGKPTRNDEQPGWRADFGPALEEDDALIYDECGRCCPQINGETVHIDYHSHHFRLVLQRGCFYLLVRHGGGQERIDIGWDHTCFAALLLPMDSDERYLMLHNLYSIHRNSREKARTAERQRWTQAAAEKRIRTRKRRGRDQVKVWIEPERSVTC